MDTCESPSASAPTSRGVSKSATQLRTELTLTLELLRQAKPFVGRCASVQAQELSDRITKHFASVLVEEKKS